MADDLPRPGAEYFFNGVPFYSLVPDPARFGSFTPYNPPRLLAGDADDEGPRAPSMSRARVVCDLDELLDAATCSSSAASPTSKRCVSTSLACCASPTRPASGRSRTATVTTCSSPELAWP